MDINVLEKEIIDDEGVRYSAYQDSLGYWTIGVGFLIDERLDGRIPKEVIQFWLDLKINECLTDIQDEPFYTSLVTDDQRRALLNMRYQLGSPKFRGFKVSLSLLSQGKFKEAGVNLRKSNWYHQTPARAERIISRLENV